MCSVDRSSDPPPGLDGDHDTGDVGRVTASGCPPDREPGFDGEWGRISRAQGREVKQRPANRSLGDGGDPRRRCQGRGNNRWPGVLGDVLVLSGQPEDEQKQESDYLSDGHRVHAPLATTSAGAHVEGRMFRVSRRAAGDDLSRSGRLLPSPRCPGQSQRKSDCSPTAPVQRRAGPRPERPRRLSPGRDRCGSTRRRARSGRPGCPAELRGRGLRCRSRPPDQPL